MLGKYKIVTIIPVGRRKYIELLFKYILDNRHIIDEHIFWINTDITYDIAYVYSLVARYPDFCKVIGTSSEQNPYIMNNIYLSNNNSKTIYIKLSDDICWIEESAIKNLAEYCLEYNDYFLVYPLIVNTGRTTVFHKVVGLLPEISLINFRKINYDLSLLEPNVSANIHINFINAIKNNNLDNYCGFIEDYSIYDYEHIPLHAVAWLGRKNHVFASMEKRQSPLFLTDIEPKRRGLCLKICGNSLMSHFSYKSHEQYLLEQTDIWEQYNLLGKKCN